MDYTLPLAMAKKDPGERTRSHTTEESKTLLSIPDHKGTSLLPGFTPV